VDAIRSAVPTGRRIILAALGESAYERLRARRMARKIRSGAYATPEIALVPHVVRRGETVVDVGANYGLYAFHLARQVGESGSVIAFEAAPGTAVALKRVLAVLGTDQTTEVLEKAVGESPGRTRLAIPRRTDGSTESGRAWSVPRGSGDPEVDFVDVEVVHLDQALAGAGEISFIKVDVEGADLHVLRGATAIIDRDAPTLLIEVSPPLLARQALTPADVEQFFDERGYATYRFDSTTQKLRPALAANTVGDLLAVHPRRLERVRALVSAQPA
jgi:FkbM family methyltransferase